MDPCFAVWARFLDELWRTDPIRVSSVLDVCCGTGLLAEQLIARGYQVTGTDASSDMLARARRRLGPDVVLVLESLPAMSLAATFDAVVSTFDGLNYLTPDDLLATLRVLADRVRPGGWLVFDLHTDAMMRFTSDNPVVGGEAAGYQFVITSGVDQGARRCETRIDVVRAVDAHAFSETHRQYFFPDDDVAAGLDGAGFDLVQVTDEYSTAPADDQTLRATWVARRRAQLSAGRGVSAPATVSPPVTSS